MLKAESEAEVPACNCWADGSLILPAAASYVWQLPCSPDRRHNISCSPPLFHGGPSPSPVIRAVKLHREMSNVCLMGVGEASIKLIVDHWVNFSYLENPSFLKCCECGGMWRKTVSKDRGAVRLKYSPALRGRPLWDLLIVMTVMMRFWCWWLF